MRKLLVLSGPICAGKTDFTKAVQAVVPVHWVSTRQFLVERHGVASERGALQEAGMRLDRETGGEWVAEAAKEAATNCPADAVLLLDSARIKGQLEALRKAFDGQVFHVHLTAAEDVLRARYDQRQHDVTELPTFDQARANATEAAVGNLAKLANLVLQTDYAGAAALATVALTSADLTPASECRPLVDVFVGAQYGSEGKGNICSFLASHYNVLMRIGGPNAGHMAPQPLYKYVQLPSGTGANPDAKILIGAGSTIWLPQLILEMADHRLTPERFAIDPQAMIIDDEDRRLEAGALAVIASTKQGVGAASARKILGRGTPIFGAPVKLARDVEQLKKFVRDTKAELEGEFAKGRRVMLEGTQGTALSLHHGHYPHVTSRETSVAGCLADAGIAPGRVNRIVLVTRTYPIRVGGTSGPMGIEIKFNQIAERSGIPLKELLDLEKGTISRTQRRVAEFDWMQFHRSILINRPTHIALTFADYYGISNREARSFDDLSQPTKDFIFNLERVAGVPVTFISKKFSGDGVLVRGVWG